MASFSPEYTPRKITIPTLNEIRALKEMGNQELRVVIDLMHGCGLRNGAAYAANLERLAADDAYRVTEQTDGRTRRPARLKHREPGKFRESPLPATVRDSVLTYAERKGVDENGYLIRTQRSPHWGRSSMQYPWASARRKAGITRKLNPYSLRHFFAFRIYRHLMPASVGRAARLLNEGL